MSRGASCARRRAVARDTFIRVPVTVNVVPSNNRLEPASGHAWPRLIGRLSAKWVVVPHPGPLVPVFGCRATPKPPVTWLLLPRSGAGCRLPFARRAAATA